MNGGFTLPVFGFPLPPVPSPQSPVHCLSTASNSVGVDAAVWSGSRPYDSRISGDGHALWMEPKGPGVFGRRTVRSPFPTSGRPKDNRQWRGISLYRNRSRSSELIRRSLETPLVITVRRPATVLRKAIGGTAGMRSSKATGSHTVMSLIHSGSALGGLSAVAAGTVHRDWSGPHG